MAKYQITHTCGHEETVQIYGTNSHGERDNKIAWLESKPCRECERKENLAKAAAWESLIGLSADMQGTEKQVAWARQIRREKLDTEQTVRMYDEYICEFLVWADEKSASWWIDNRNYDGWQIIDKFQAEYVAAHPEEFAEQGGAE